MEQEPKIFEKKEAGREQNKENFLEKMEADEQAMIDHIKTEHQEPSEELEKRTKMLKLATKFIEKE